MKRCRLGMAGLRGEQDEIEGVICGDPETPLRWVGRRQRRLAEALRGEGFEVSQKLVGSLLNLP